jgi:hypothetical protein
MDLVAKHAPSVAKTPDTSPNLGGAVASHVDIATKEGAAGTSDPTVVPSLSSVVTSFAPTITKPVDAVT